MNFSILRILLTITLVLGALSPAFAVDKFYNADFKGWRDNRTDSGFNAKLEREGTKARISVSSPYQFGKAMTPAGPISMRFTPTLILQITVAELEEGGILSVEIVNAGPPYDGYKVLTDISQPGTYNTNIGKATEWTGNRNFWIAVWLEGTGKEAVVSKLRIGEKLAPVKALAAAASKKKSEPKKSPKAPVAAREGEDDAKRMKIDFRGDTTKNYKHFEDWSEGRGGWRDGTTNKGMDTEITVKKGGRIRVKLQERATYGKIMSKEKPLVVDFRKFPFLEVELERELEVGRVKVQLVQARNPDNFHVVIPGFSRPGVYIANIPEVAGWKKKEAFFIEIWLEGAGTEISLRSIGFSRKMSVLQGIMTPVQSVRAAELAPSKQADVLKIAGVADQTFRGQWLQGVANDPEWGELNRYGMKLINIGYSEIAQKLYFIFSIHPAEEVSLYGAIGYDLVNEFEGLLWEDPFARAIKAKIDAGLVKIYDFYAGNVAQIGSVYDPLFTDLTFKKASTFRGFLWKPQAGDFNFKLFGTRLLTDPSDYKENIYLTAARVSNNFTLPPGSIRLGLNAVNLAKTNGEIGSDLFQGKVDPEIYQNYVPSIYLKIENNTDTNAYYNTDWENSVTIVGTAGAPVDTIHIDFRPTGGSIYIYDQNKTYFDEGSVAQGINAGGYITYRFPLRLDLQTLLEPSDIRSITFDLEMGGWAQPTTGEIEFFVSSDGRDWQKAPLANQNDAKIIADSDFIILDDYINNTGIFNTLVNGNFDSTEETLARSILSVDASGQLFSVNLDAEYAVSLAHNQTFRGERVTHQANAFYVKASRGFSGALLKAAYFQVMPEYDTSLVTYNSVDDNDNGTLMPDLYQDKSGVVFGDYSNRGWPDKEYVIGLYVPEDYLLIENEDRNHNGLLDTRENDHEPDYPYRRDQRGYDISLFIPRQVLENTDLADFEFEARGLVVERISEPGINQTVDAQLNYINTSIEDWYFKAGIYAASVIDQLSDQYQMYGAGGKENKVKSETKDEVEIPVTVDYLHNLVITPSLTIKYDAPWGLRGTLVNRFRYNQPFFSDQAKQQGNEVDVDLRYRHYVMGGFSMTPIYQGRFNARQANAASPVHNTYYLPYEHAGGDWRDIPIFHGFYLKTLYPIMDEYKLAVDLGHELSLHALRGMPDKIHDKLAVGLLRDLPRGYLRVQWEMNKVYFPYDNAENWGQSALWAQFTLTF